MRKILFTFLSLFTCFYLSTAIGNEVTPSSESVSTVDYPELNLTQLRLANGMTVWLKPTDFETDEVFFKLAAVGGFACLKSQDRFSGELSAQIAWESGMGGLSSDKVSVLLYEHSLEFVPKIQAYSRIIEGVSGKEGVEAFFQCTNMVFTKQNFSEEGWKAARLTARNSLNVTAKDYELAYEAAFLRINTQSLEPLCPLVAEDLEKVNFATAKEFFQNSFGDPSDFVCVVVGSFDLEEVKALALKYLGAIPRKKSIYDFKQKAVAPFPKGITQKEIKLSQRPDSLTRLAFPLKISLDETSIQNVAFTCQIIEAHLRRILTQQMQMSYGIDVSYEFPLYPLLENPWISVRYRCDESLVERLKQLIVKELQFLQEKGVSQNEIEEIKKLEAGSDEFWLRDNCYWASTLANYYLWNWDPRSIYHELNRVDDLSAQTINNLMKSSFSLHNYSIVTARP